jgi:lysozyme
MRSVSDAGVNLIISFEGLKLSPYPDAVGIPTIGYGTIMYPDGRKVSLNDPEITQAEATEYLQHQMNLKASAVEGMVTVDLNDNEFAALVCFAYNVGVGGLHGSTLLTMLNAGQDRTAVADQFLRWNKAGGREIPGLTRRRQAERSLFLHSTDLNTPSDDDINIKLSDIENKVQ